MTETKPTFTYMSQEAFQWFVECYSNAVAMTKASPSILKKGVPSLGQHFCNYYGVNDDEVKNEKDIAKQFEMIRAKYVK